MAGFVRYPLKELQQDARRMMRSARKWAKASKFKGDLVPMVMLASREASCSCGAALQIVAVDYYPRLEGENRHRAIESMAI